LTVGLVVLSMIILKHKSGYSQGEQPRNDLVASVCV